MDRKKGIDISEFNGDIHFEAVKAAGIEFAIIRAGYGSKTRDSRAAEYFEGAAAVGLDTGAYWFSYALSEQDARNEAKLLLQVTADYDTSYPLCWDFEQDSVRYAGQNGVTVTKQLATKMAAAFCDEIRAAGKIPAVYSNQSFLSQYFDREALKDYDLWYAYYHDTLDRKDVGLWQYSDKGTVSGIVGNVDVDYACVDYTASAEHWAEGAYDYLAKNYGFYLYNKDFDREVTMGELVTVLARLNGYEK